MKTVEVVVSIVSSYDINLNLVLNKVLGFLHRLSIRDINILILKLIVRIFRNIFSFNIYFRLFLNKCQLSILGLNNENTND